MATPQIAPYGTWASPIASESIVAATIGLGQVALDGDDLYWTELRPQEKGRNTLLRRTPDGTVTDLTPGDWNVRTRAHEYGGVSYLVAEGMVIFSNFADQALYCKSISGKSMQGDPQPITPTDTNGNLRFADGVCDRRHQRLICVREDHRGEGEAVNTLVSVPLAGMSEGEVLVSGADFYSTPCLSPDGQWLSWLCWHHPDMPWDATELWVASVQADGSLGKPRCVAGKTWGKSSKQRESIFQPQWSPDGRLYWVGDRSGWWNLYRQSVESLETDDAPESVCASVCPMEAEFGLPQWVFGMSTYGFASGDRLICTYTREGIWYLASLDLTSGTLTDFDLPYTDFSAIQTQGDRAACIAGSPTEPTSLVELNLTTGDWTVAKKASTLDIDPGYLAPAQPIAFPTADGHTAYGIFYPPTNKDFQAPTGEKPPLLVKSHGGPTAATSSSLNLRVQYWTSRGFALLDVNYRGSTGYGRVYRQQLHGQWGIADVEDCVNGARYLADRGWADGNRMAIAGGSAGGYTTLCALTFRDTFAAGASYYGVSDLKTLALETHKFESRYLDSLVGTYPEQADIYQARSPIHHCDRLSCPIIFFQGLEDKVVPPNQAETMFEVLKTKGVPVAYVPFEGEQHGFRRAENIKRALDAEFYFYARVFGYTPADAIDPVEILNLDANQV